MGMFDLLKTPTAPAQPVEAYVPEDLSALTDREVIEATYHKIAAAEHLLGQVLKAAASNPMLGSFLPKGM